MSVLQAAATTVTQISGTSRKFYTIHVIGETEIRQWGRIGAKGQFSVTNHGSKREAEHSAERQLSAKERKGYGNRQSTVYALDEKFLHYNDAAIADIAHSAHMAAAAKTSQQTIRNGLRGEGATYTAVDELADARDEDVHLRVFDSFNERALSVIGTAASGGEEAATTYAALREEFTGMEEGYDRCKSLLETLEIMLTSEVSA